MAKSFEEIHKLIQNFLAEKKGDAYALEDKEYRLPLSDAIFCAEDHARNRAFFEAIGKAVSDLNGGVSVDAGSGVGILGAFALAHGARKCVFLEHNPHSLELSKKLIAYLGFSDQNEFIQCDASDYELPEPYDLLISETITSGFVREDFPKIINHLKQFGSEKSIIIPSKFEVTMNGAGEPQVFYFESKKGIEPPRVKGRVTFRTKAELYGGIYLKTGQCMSFLNEQSLDLTKNAHPLF